MKTELETILVNLLTEYMNLPDNYGTDKHGDEIPVIVIKGQNVKLHSTSRLQITVGVINTHTYANNSYFINNNTPEEPQYADETDLHEQSTVQIDIYSADNEARKRYKEVQTCLTSLLAQQYQDKYQFRISQISDAVNTTGLDGAGYLNRFSIRFNCLTWFKKSVDINYYDKFSMTAQTEQGQRIKILKNGKD